MTREHIQARYTIETKDGTVKAYEVKYDTAVISAETLISCGIGDADGLYIRDTLDDGFSRVKCTHDLPHSAAEVNKCDECTTTHDLGVLLKAKNQTVKNQYDQIIELKRTVRNHEESIMVRNEKVNELDRVISELRAVIRKKDGSDQHLRNALDRVNELGAKIDSLYGEIYRIEEDREILRKQMTSHQCTAMAMADGWDNEKQRYNSRGKEILKLHEYISDLKNMVGVTSRASLYAAVKAKFADPPAAEIQCGRCEFGYSYPCEWAHCNLVQSKCEMEASAAESVTVEYEVHSEDLDGKKHVHVTDNEWMVYRYRADSKSIGETVVNAIREKVWGSGC